jgi:hypothetical protein
MIVVPALARRAAGDVARIVSEYADDAMRELGAEPTSFTEANRNWMLRHAASSFVDIEIGTRRLVAIGDAGTVYQAAVRLGMSHVGLGKWFKRRWRGGS